MSTGFYVKIVLYTCFQRFVHSSIDVFVQIAALCRRETIHEISRKSLYILEKPCYTEAARTSELAGIQQDSL
jgi:hypothetical protein